MPDTEITPDNLVPALLGHARRRGFPAGWRAGSNPVNWRATGQRILRDLALPDLPDLPIAADVRHDVRTPWGRLQEITLDFGSGLVASARLALPDGTGPHPAALALHDHGSEFAIGKEKCLPGPAPDPVADAWVLRFFGGQSYGAELARRGFAVLSVDALGWGGRGGNGYASQQALAVNLMQIGLSPAGVMAWEDSRAAAWLATHPAVDARRIASVGFSLGGFRAWQLAALSPHIAATVSISWMASLPGLLIAGNNQTRGQSAVWMTHPLLARHLDLPDIAALSAPRPMWAEVGLADHLFPAPSVDAAFATLADVWQAFGAADRLALHRPPCGHSFLPDRQTVAFDWLQRHLR
jgi:dienelactone hydrolase